MWIPRPAKVCMNECSSRSIPCFKASCGTRVFKLANLLFLPASYVQQVVVDWINIGALSTKKAYKRMKKLAEDGAAGIVGSSSLYWI